MIAQPFKASCVDVGVKEHGEEERRMSNRRRTKAELEERVEELETALEFMQGQLSELLDLDEDVDLDKEERD